MPNLNQTGPMGQGSMTGRKMGKCTNFGARVESSNDNPIQENAPSKGRGLRGGLGRGLGRNKGQGQGQNLVQGQGGCGMGRKNRGGNAN